jgi:hypothetical protein
MNDENREAKKKKIRVLLYGSRLPATFWSVALLHVAWLHNRRVHRSILKTPFEGWHGIKPSLSRIRVFGSRACVKKTGKCHSKLDRHDFTGIFLGYTATDENIQYVDVDSRTVKSSHYAIFDEAWYLYNPDDPLLPECSTMWVLNLCQMKLCHHLLDLHPKLYTHPCTSLLS